LAERSQYQPSTADHTEAAAEQTDDKRERVFA